MDERILQTMREKILSQDYVMTTHADEEMWEDGLTIHGVENTILTGRIVERQQDRHSDEWKYLVRSDSERGAVVVVAKIGFTGELVIITVYLE
jgi:hypothetical protein